MLFKIAKEGQSVGIASEMSQSGELDLHDELSQFSGIMSASVRTSKRVFRKRIKFFVRESVAYHSPTPLPRLESRSFAVPSATM